MAVTSWLDGEYVEGRELVRQIEKLGAKANTHTIVVADSGATDFRAVKDFGIIRRHTKRNIILSTKNKFAMT